MICVRPKTPARYRKAVMIADDDKMKSVDQINFRIMLMIHPIPDFQIGD